MTPEFWEPYVSFQVFDRSVFRYLTLLPIASMAGHACRPVNAGVLRGMGGVASHRHSLILRVNLQCGRRRHGADARHDLQATQALHHRLSELFAGGTVSKSDVNDVSKASKVTTGREDPRDCCAVTSSRAGVSRNVLEV